MKEIVSNDSFFKKLSGKIIFTAIPESHVLIIHSLATITLKGRGMIGIYESKKDS